MYRGPKEASSEGHILEKTVQASSISFCVSICKCKWTGMLINPIFMCVLSVAEKQKVEGALQPAFDNGREKSSSDREEASANYC